MSFCLSLALEKTNSKYAVMNNDLLLCCLQVPHFVSTPCSVVDIFKAKAAIETFCAGIAFVDQKADRLFPSLLVDEFSQQQRGESLVTIACIYGKRVDIVLTRRPSMN